ncbi:AAA family ATPase [Halorussus limi]|uniref:AAA family ATPase n=1 Tax=Halorussus limi TaxID=2938695 RepID=A0A8U0HW98_9EURY|nr:AAA family ATPase [Halorussus limi]UPV75197.1 AAA family ATPase [Halorussus limi]
MSETESLDARQRTPQFVVVCGLPGVGKTTVAEDIAERLDGRLLRTDVVRKDILDDPDYTEAEARMVYRELFERASDVVEGGRSVVLDGTFKDAADRERAVELCESLDAEFRLVKVECDEAVVRDRIASREDDASDADFEVHAMYREQFDAVSADHVTVDNSESAAETRRQVAEQF